MGSLSSGSTRQAPGRGRWEGASEVTPRVVCRVMSEERTEQGFAGRIGVWQMAAVPCGRRERSTTGAWGLSEVERPQWALVWSVLQSQWLLSGRGAHSSRGDCCLGGKASKQDLPPLGAPSPVSGTDPALASRAPRRLCGSSLGQCPAWGARGTPRGGGGACARGPPGARRAGGREEDPGWASGRGGRDSWAGGRFASEGLCEGSARWVRLSEEETEVETGGRRRRRDRGTGT